MSVHTRTHHIRKRVSPLESGEEGLIPWMEALGVDEETAPGAVLKGSRIKEGLTQKELAKKLGVLPHHISEMERAKRPIGKKIAHRLAKIFKTSYRLFL